MAQFPAIKPQIFTGNEQIDGNVTLLNYWQWAHSNLVDNAERGAFAEYLVRIAVGADSSSPSRLSILLCSIR